ncbi:hypothetical protein D3C81_1834330 [compost metagenome]
MSRTYRQVEKEEFEAFVKSYPNELRWDVTGICEPPLGTYNDFTKGNWPESIVAKVKLMDGSSYYDFKTDEYFILETEVLP